MINIGSIDKYWSCVFNLRSASNELKYPNVTKVVKAILCLSHGSASIERGFFHSGHVLTNDKVNMNEHVKCKIEHFMWHEIVQTSSTLASYSGNKKKPHWATHFIKIEKILLKTVQFSIFIQHNFEDEMLKLFV